MQPPTHEDLCVLEALVDQTRILMLQRLAHKPMTQLEFSSELGLSQPLVRHHLETLRKAGMVKTHRAGRYVKYTVIEQPYLIVSRINTKLFIEGIIA